MSWLSDIFFGSQLSTLKKRMDVMSERFDELVSRVTEIETVSGSAIELLHSLKAQLDEAVAGGNMAAIQELSDRLGMQSQELADAIAANTEPVDPGLDPVDPGLPEGELR